MATQDANSAVRFFRKHASDYCVDTSMIFTIGTSAGGAIVLSNAYWDQEEADVIFDTADWGPIDNSSGNEGYSSRTTARFPAGEEYQIPHGCKMKQYPTNFFTAQMILPCPIRMD